jgi:His-Xaa-Ser system protein HxsD
MAELIIEFDRSSQSIGSLQEAAYRLIGVATCQIVIENDRYICRVISSPGSVYDNSGAEKLREHFLNLVTDENLREKLSVETGHVRDVILALAFGALVSRQNAAN